MKPLTGFEVFQYYMAVKLHFTTDYDYFRYGGKGKNITQKAYRQRREITLFEVLAGKFRRDQILPVLVANFIANDALWIGDFLFDYEKINNTYLEWKGKLQRLEYVYENDLQNLFSFAEENSLDIREIFVYNNTHPLIFKFLLNGMIEPESFIILYDQLDLFDRDQPHDVVWNHEILKLRKYKSFLPYDKEIYKQITEKYLVQLNKK